MFFPVFNLNYIIFMIPAYLLTLIVQLYVNSSYRRWSQVRNWAGITGADAVDVLARHIHLSDLKIKGTGGKLSDHYDPRSNTLSLSQGVANSPSVVALAVAAHEMGHAQQDQEGYFPLKLRSAMVPMVNIGTTLGWVFIFIGLILRFSDLAWVGLIVFSAGALFSVATLPVELNASKRARLMLTESGLIHTEEEQKGINQVLNAAALTYVAAVATSVMQVLYFGSLVSGMGRRR